MVTSVHLPLCNTSFVHLMDVARLVNGDATDASPNATLFNSVKCTNVEIQMYEQAMTSVVIQSHTFLCLSQSSHMLFP